MGVRAIFANRPDLRPFDQIRPIQITRNFVKYPAGSVLVEFGDTRVICTATIDTSVPRFLRNTGKGWVTAEYGMLPGATDTRTDREASRGKQSGRTVEIQRFIGRALRMAANLDETGEITIRIDCDVIQADGGTRTASITGGCVALYDALQQISPSAFNGLVAAVSVGAVAGQPVVDLEYAEDSIADTDMNVVMKEGAGFIEIQGTAELEAFPRERLDTMLSLAESAIDEIFLIQRKVIGN